MQDPKDPIPQASRREPWNKGKLIGTKPPLRPKHVWSIRTKLQIAGRTRDLAMFNLAIDSKLRGCDVVSLRVEDVAPHGHAVDRATVRQKKTGQPVRFEITEQTREAVDSYIGATRKAAGRVPLQRPARSGPTDNDATVRPTGLPMDCKHWFGPKLLWHALTAPNQSDTHIPSHWQSAGGPASVRPQEDREHRALSGD
jgi:integrase